LLLFLFLSVYHTLTQSCIRTVKGTCRTCRKGRYRKRGWSMAAAQRAEGVAPAIDNRRSCLHYPHMPHAHLTGQWYARPSQAATQAWLPQSYKLLGGSQSQQQQQQAGNTAKSSRAAGWPPRHNRAPLVSSRLQDCALRHSKRRSQEARGYDDAVHCTPRASTPRAAPPRSRGPSRHRRTALPAARPRRR
jgi:hypothetical protein